MAKLGLLSNEDGAVGRAQLTRALKALYLEGKGEPLSGRHCDGLGLRAGIGREEQRRRVV